MEYLNGQTLSDKLVDGLVREREAAEMMVAINRAVGFANRHGVMYRDLKPSNIVIALTGDLVVTDFRLAKRLGVKNELICGGVVVGTPSYMSPEQASGRKDNVGPPIR